MRCTIGQIEEFKESFIWLDILDELKVWREQIHEQLENIDGDLDHRSLDRLSGNAQAIRNFEDLLDVLISIEEGKRQKEEVENA